MRVARRAAQLTRPLARPPAASRPPCELREKRRNSPGPAGLQLAEAEDELGVFGHLLRAPRWIPGQLGFDLLDALDVLRGFDDLLLDERADRAAHRGEGVLDVDVRPVDGDVVEEPELDDVHAELGVFDDPERVDDLLATRHEASVAARRPATCGGCAR